jgi:GntR family transcriptional regulator
MQFWFARGTEVTLREQLVTQVVLGILCGDLSPGQRLPSTRELARRFRLHPNTISAGYRQLERERWVEFRRGSGVYISESKPDAPLSSALALDQLIANLFRSARELGAPLCACGCANFSNCSRPIIFYCSSRMKNCGESSRPKCSRP